MKINRKNKSKYCNVTKTQGRAPSTPPPPCTTVGVWFCLYIRWLISNCPSLEGLIKQFLRDVDWGEVDYLVVDTPPGTSDEHLSIVQYLSNTHVDGAIIITTPQARTKIILFQLIYSSWGKRLDSEQSLFPFRYSWAKRTAKWARISPAMWKGQGNARLSALQLPWVERETARILAKGWLSLYLCCKTSLGDSNSSQRQFFLFYLSCKINCHNYNFCQHK